MIGLMVRFMALAALMIGCGDGATASAPGTDRPSGSGLPGTLPPRLPGTVALPTPGTGGQGGAGGMGGASGAGGSMGACDNPGDLAVLQADDPSPFTTTRCGGIACFSDTVNANQYAQCVSDCVAGDTPGLSTGCADCYGELLACGLANFCFPQCQAGACSPSCESCLSFYGCVEVFEQCSGLIGSPCP
ncbi:MAG: hypothetical protein AAGF92_13750 [Myxococcota bacterium]